MRLCPDRLNVIVYLGGRNKRLLLGDLGKAAPNPIVYQSPFYLRVTWKIHLTTKFPQMGRIFAS